MKDNIRNYMQIGDSRLRESSHEIRHIFTTIESYRGGDDESNRCNNYYETAIRDFFRCVFDMRLRLF